MPPGVKALLYCDGTDVLLQADNQVSIGGFLPGVPAGSAVLFQYVASRPFALPAGLAASRGYAKTAATAQADFDLRKNGLSVGTASFAAAATTPSFTFGSAQGFAPGDRLEVVCPSTADATLADISLTLAGYGT